MKLLGDVPGPTSGGSPAVSLRLIPRIRRSFQIFARISPTVGTESAFRSGSFSSGKTSPRLWPRLLVRRLLERRHVDEIREEADENHFLS